MLFLKQYYKCSEMDEYHNIVVHFGENISTICDVDPNRYSHLDLVEKLGEMWMGDMQPIKVTLAFTIYVVRPNGIGQIVVENDKDLLEVFSLYRYSREIHAFVDVIVGNQTNLPIPPSSGNEGGIHTNVEIGIASRQTPSPNRETEVWNDSNDEYDDNVYGFSSEDEDWRAEGDDIPNARHECQYVCHVEKNSDDGFSDYESGDEGAAISTDTDIDVDEESGVNRKKKEVYNA